MLTTKQDRTSDGKLVKGAVINPDGKGGFKDNPQNRADGRWNKEGSISYQYNHLMRMTIDELKNFTPETVAQQIALARVIEAKKQTGLADAREITDRTEGKAPQYIGLGNPEDAKKALVEFIHGTTDSNNSDTD